MTDKYANIFALQDVVLQEIKDAGFVSGPINLVSKVVIKLNDQGVCYDITYFKDFPNEFTTSITAEKSSLIDNLNIDTPRFSKDGTIRMDLCEVLITIAAWKIPDVKITYEMLMKEV